MLSKFKELSRGRIQENRMAIVSQNLVEGGFTIAQQVTLQEGDNKNINIFMKGALHVGDIEGLMNLRDAINEALDKQID